MAKPRHRGRPVTLFDLRRVGPSVVMTATRGGVQLGPPVAIPPNKVGEVLEAARLTAKLLYPEDYRG